MLSVDLVFLNFNGKAIVCLAFGCIESSPTVVNPLTTLSDDKTTDGIAVTEEEPD